MKTDYTRYYSKWHEETPEHQAAMTAYYHRLLKPHLPKGTDSVVLDVGCGAGYALFSLREMGYLNISGVERDEGQHRACINKGLKVHLTEDTIGFLECLPCSCDAILVLDVIEHIPVNEQLKFVSTLAQALKPGGKLICTVPNANSALASRWRYNDWTHHSSFTEHSIDFLLFNGGLRDICVFPAEFFERPQLWWLPVSGGRHWWAFRFFRFFRRLEMMAELGPSQGRTVPLSLNLLTTATKPAS